MNTALAPWGTFLLRVTSGVAFIAHGLYLKAFVFGMAGASGFFESLGLPGFVAWLVMLAETVGGVMLVLGVHVRLASLCLIPILLGAAWAHAGNGWVFSAAGGGWEYPIFWAVAQTVILLQGPGALALPVSLAPGGRRSAA